MSIILRTATPVDLDRLLPALDEQFVFGKGRRLSLRARFPSMFEAGNADNVFICEGEGALLSALSILPFEWLADGQLWRGAMIGTVYTDPAHRNAGHASRVLTWTMEKLKERGVDFGVLWTAQPGFYARLGWTSTDCGVLAEIRTSSSSPSLGNDVTTIAAGTADVLRIEQIRQQWLATRMPRTSRDYRRIPLPADTVDVHAWRLHEPSAGYALIGRAGDIGYVYEMVGTPEGFSALWREVQQRYRRLLVNDCEGSASCEWLAHETGIAWQRKSLAMWYPISDRVQGWDFSHWYIPYFDRI